MAVDLDTPMSARDDYSLSGHSNKNQFGHLGAVSAPACCNLSLIQSDCLIHKACIPEDPP